jgi:hypothetical protein
MGTGIQQDRIECGRNIGMKYASCNAILSVRFPNDCYMRVAIFLDSSGKLDKCEAERWAIVAFFWGQRRCGFRFEQTPSSTIGGNEISNQDGLAETAWAFYLQAEGESIK